MATYISLLRWTQQGIEKVKESPARADAVKQAAQAMRQGSGSAIESGTQGGAGLNSAASALERIIENKPELSDVTAEDAPKQYESAISDYFKRLSRAE